ncbi:sodium:proline symporter, partial [Staphylococcus haemolyticus]
GLSRTGAISGMISGSVVVIIWIVFVKPLGEYNDFFNLYEIIPGFLTSLIVTYIVSLMTKKPNRDVEKELEEVKKLVKEK